MERARRGRVSAGLEEEIRSVWQQLAEDCRRNGNRTTNLHSRANEARAAMERLRWELDPDVRLPAGPKGRAGRPKDYLAEVSRLQDRAWRRDLSACVKLLLWARREARRRGYSIRNLQRFRAAVRQIIAEQFPPGRGYEIGRERDARFTPVVVEAEEAADFFLSNYSRLSDELKTPRAVEHRFGTQHRTTRLRQRRRDLHT